MIYDVSVLWVWALLALIVGVVFGGMTYTAGRQTPWFDGWFRWSLILFVVGLVIAWARIFPGRLGFAVEMALLFYAAYVIGCLIGGFLRDAFAPPPAPGSKPSSPRPASAPSSVAVGTPTPGAVGLMSAQLGSMNGAAGVSATAGAENIHEAPANDAGATAAATSSHEVASAPAIVANAEAPAETALLAQSSNTEHVGATGSVIAAAAHVVSTDLSSAETAVAQGNDGSTAHAAASTAGEVEVEAEGVAGIGLPVSAAAPESEGHHPVALTTAQTDSPASAQPEEPEPATMGHVDGEEKHGGSRPMGLVSPRGGKPDDLKRIKGIGPQNEGRLHALGIWHFAQIAAWTPENVQWVGSYLAFPGRIDREQWIVQSTALAQGRDTEFSKRVDRGEIPSSVDTGSAGQDNVADLSKVKPHP